MQMPTTSPSGDDPAPERAFSSTPEATEDRKRKWLQYAGIALVGLAYIGGLIWWTYASMNIEPSRDSGLLQRVEPVLKTMSVPSAEPVASPLPAPATAEQRT